MVKDEIRHIIQVPATSTRLRFADVTRAANREDRPRRKLDKDLHELSDGPQKLDKDLYELPDGPQKLDKDLHE